MTKDAGEDRAYIDYRCGDYIMTEQAGGKEEDRSSSCGTSSIFPAACKVIAILIPTVVCDLQISSFL